MNNVLVFSSVAIVVLLALAHGFRAFPAVGSRTYGVALLAGFVAGCVGVHQLVDKLQLVRESKVDSAFAYGLRALARPSGPVLFIVGSSYSSRGLDEKRIERALRKAGHDYEVINISSVGMSYQERDTLLRKLPETGGPDVMLLEFSEIYDTDPAIAFRLPPFSNRAINQYDATGAWFTLVGLSGARHRSAGENRHRAWLVVQHALLNLANLGFVHSAHRLAETRPRSGFRPLDVPGRFDDELIRERLDAEVIAATEPVPVQLWATRIRDRQATMSRARGARSVGFYAPPTLYPAQMKYADAVCDSGEYEYCFSPNDQSLLAPLVGPYWKDIIHLNSKGSVLFSDWFARELIVSGILN